MDDEDIRIHRRTLEYSRSEIDEDERIFSRKISTELFAISRTHPFIARDIGEDARFFLHERRYPLLLFSKEKSQLIKEAVHIAIAVMNFVSDIFVGLLDSGVVFELLELVVGRIPYHDIKVLSSELSRIKVRCHFVLKRF